ncbi:SDR family oxidoreductase [Rhizobium sp. BK491]|uniref:SDR family oxidoreductase n=1 Tax=Rhizobium sp. BK491 TaxID=2587009 RepID=UPI001622BAB6|nr:gluconate 5-dehydrogenase [Rhizobium sp. BK491]
MNGKDIVGGLEAFNLVGKNAMVTGAGRGIGRAIAEGLAAAGANVLLASRTENNLADTAATIRAGGRRVETTRADISLPDDCEALMRRANDLFGAIDILVCNAATNIQGVAAGMTAESWRRVIDVELSGYFYLSKAAHPYMASRRSGSIIFVSANSSLVGYADLVAVATAKGGLDMMARNLAVEWGSDGIRVNTINPGWTEHVPPDGADVAAGTGDLEEDIRATTPLQRRGTMREFGAPAVFLASDAASYITGQNLIIDGGYSVK